MGLHVAHLGIIDSAPPPLGPTSSGACGGIAHSRTNPFDISPEMLRPYQWSCRGAVTCDNAISTNDCVRTFLISGLATPKNLYSVLGKDTAIVSSGGLDLRRLESFCCEFEFSNHTTSFLVFLFLRNTHGCCLGCVRE